MNCAQDNQVRRILFLQDHLETGGAARAAGRFRRRLLEMGIEVGVAAGDGASGAARFRVTGKPARGVARIWELLSNSSARIGNRQKKARIALESVLETFQPDLVWIHNVHGGFKWGWSEDLIRLSLARHQVLWTLHDMWALGNGPSYFSPRELKERHQTSCLHRLWQDLEGSQSLLLTPSIWLRDLVRAAGCYRCEAWINPLDTNTFSPGPRNRIRRELGLRDGEVLLLAAAENLADPRKGITLLEQAWNDVRRKSHLRLGLIGRNGPEALKKDRQAILFGEVASESRMAELMAAADLFLHPAEMESYGLVLEEGQACGTPVLAFRGCGVDELLGDTPNGWLLPERSTLALSEKLAELAQNTGILTSMREPARESMVRKHGGNSFAQQWRQVNEWLKSSADPFSGRVKAARGARN